MKHEQFEVIRGSGNVYRFSSRRFWRPRLSKRSIVNVFPCGRLMPVPGLPQQTFPAFVTLTWVDSRLIA